MNYHKYTIEMGVCDECRDDLIEPVTHSFEQKYADFRRPDGGVSTQYVLEYRKAIVNLPQSPTFSFVADCGGDAIYLCLRHLLEAVDALAQFKGA